MKHIVSVADMKWSCRPDDTIVTHGLGSCLGITVYDPVVRVGGMLHVMMPNSTANPQKARANPYMFVDTAVPAFFGRLESAGVVLRRSQLKVAGGAVVNGNGRDFFETGKRNLVAAKKALWRASILIAAQDVGGHCARTLYMALEDGRVWFTTAGKRRDL